MDQNNNQQPMPLQLDLKPEVASGEYSNLVLISHSHSDFVLDFARALPGLPKPEVASRIIMAPEHAKRLLGALQENIYKYEKNSIYSNVIRRQRIFERVYRRCNGYKSR